MLETIPDIVFAVPRSASSRSCQPSCTACIVVDIVDDNTLEEKFESFAIGISHSDITGVLFTSTNTTVVIQDDDCESRDQ